jgi:hypothetical protein
MITRSIGAQFAPRVVQGEAGRPGATLKPVAPKKALFNQLKQRMLVICQNVTRELTLANLPAWAKKGTLLSSCADNRGELFATKTTSYKWQHRRI